MCSHCCWTTMHSSWPATPLTNGMISEMLRQFVPRSFRSVATYLRCGRIFIVMVLLLFFLILKQFWKLHGQYLIKLKRTKNCTIFGSPYIRLTTTQQSYLHHCSSSSKHPLLVCGHSAASLVHVHRHLSFFLIPVCFTLSLGSTSCLNSLRQPRTNLFMSDPYLPSLALHLLLYSLTVSPLSFLMTLLLLFHSWLDQNLLFCKSFPP